MTLLFHKTTIFTNKEGVACFCKTEEKLIAARMIFWGANQHSAVLYQNDIAQLWEYYSTKIKDHICFNGHMITIDQSALRKYSTIYYYMPIELSNGW